MDRSDRSFRCKAAVLVRRSPATLPPRSQSAPRLRLQAAARSDQRHRPQPPRSPRQCSEGCWSARSTSRVACGTPAAPTRPSSGYGSRRRARRLDLNQRPFGPQPSGFRCLCVRERRSFPMCPRPWTVWTDRTVHRVPKRYYAQLHTGARFVSRQGPAADPRERAASGLNRTAASRPSDCLGRRFLSGTRCYLTTR